MIRMTANRIQVVPGWKKDLFMICQHVTDFIYFSLTQTDRVFCTDY